MGLLETYLVTQEPKYLNADKSNLDFIIRELKKSGHRLDRNFKNGRSTINAFLDDYSLLIQLLIRMGEVTGESHFFTEAKAFGDYALAHFFSEDQRTFFYTSDIDPPLVARKIQIADDVIPSSNAIMAQNLHLLFQIFGEARYRDISDQMLYTILPSFAEARSAEYYPSWLLLFLQKLVPTQVAVVSGPNQEIMRHELLQSGVKNCLVVTQDGYGLELLEGKEADGEDLIFIGQEGSCQAPVSSVNETLSEILRLQKKVNN